jgi:2-polyprenyl-3-methyl-5-hydroxy-6-metoxy-1,4-benzoquinol methylase
MDQGMYADALTFFVRHLPGLYPQVLDVACGPGNITRYICNQRPDIQATGIDLAEKMLELARQNNPKAHFESLDARDIDQLGLTFHGIILGFILPYLSKEETAFLIQKCAENLCPEGVLYLSTMEDAYEKSGYILPSSGVGPAVYTHYHEAAALRKILSGQGFQVMFEDRKQYQNGKGEPVTDLILVAKK